MKEMALILQGGGALGAFEYGVVSQLVELGWTPKAVSGVSIGAINAAAIAGARGGDIPTSLENIWSAITLPQVPWLPASQQSNLSLLGNPNFWRSRTDYYSMTQWTSFCDTSPMHATLARLVDFGQLNDATHVRLAVTATDLQTGGPTTFSNYLSEGAHAHTPHHAVHRAQLGPEHILASGSLPPGFPATRIEGREYWDGGLFSNTPIDALLNLLDEDDIANLPIFVVDLFPTAGLTPPANMVEVQTRATALQYENRFWAQYGGNGGLQGFVDMLDAMDDLLEKDGGGALTRMPSFQWLMRLRALRNLHIIEASPAAAGGDHDFSPYGVQMRYQAGRDAVLQHAEQWDARMRLLAAA